MAVSLQKHKFSFHLMYVCYGQTNSINMHTYRIITNNYRRKKHASTDKTVFLTFQYVDMYALISTQSQIIEHCTVLQHIMDIYAHKKGQLLVI